MSLGLGKRYWPESQIASSSAVWASCRRARSALLAELHWRGRYMKLVPDFDPADGVPVPAGRHRKESS